MGRAYMYARALRARVKATGARAHAQGDVSHCLTVSKLKESKCLNDLA